MTVQSLLLSRADVKAEFEEKLAAISKTVEKCFLERTVAKFEQKPAISSESIDSLDLGNMEENMATMSTEPITVGPTTPGSCDPSGLQDKRSVQSNCSEQLMSQLLQLDWALSEESVLKQPCSLPPEDSSGSAPSSPVSFEIISPESPESIAAPEAHSPGGIDIGNTELDDTNSGLEGEQSESPAALDTSEELPPQAERGLLLLQQTLNAQPPAAVGNVSDTAKRAAQRQYYVWSKLTSDMLADFDELESELEESFSDDSDSELKFSNSDSWDTVEDTSDTEEDSCDSELDGEQSEPPAALDSSEGLPPQTEKGLLPLPQSLSAQPPAAVVGNVSDTETRAAQRPYYTWSKHTSDVLADFDELESELEESFSDDSDSELKFSNSDSWDTVEDTSDSEEDSCDSELDGEQSEPPAALDSSEGLPPQTEKGLLPLPQSLSPQPPAAAVGNVSDTETRAAQRPYYTWSKHTSDVLADFDELEPELEESFSDDSDSELKFSNSDSWDTVEDTSDTEEDSCDSELDGEQSEPPAALDSSEGLPPQTEKGLLPLPQSLSPQPPAAAVGNVSDTETRAAQRPYYTWSKHTSDVLADFDMRSLGPNPQYSLEDSFMLLNYDARLLKMKGLELIQELAESQPEALIQMRQEVCRAVVREVMSHHWAVSNAALWTLTDLFTFLKRDLDPELDWVANALLQKTASDNEALQRIANVALGHMISSCSPLRCMEALLNGLRSLTEEDLEEKQTVQWDSDQAAAVRESIAELLLTLVQSAGAQPFLSLQQEMLERVLSTVSRLSQDASERVRSCARKSLCLLSAQQEVNKNTVHKQVLKRYRVDGDTNTEIEVIVTCE
ncbi:hypothetical protein GJAV_G00244550 [Gymnothorax javanicus]|nr:hypothetical protein GJAV_G00244550 [Gymnothorax javanicus]